MSRVKTSEYTAKKVLYPALGLQFHGLSLTLGSNQNWSPILADLRQQFSNENLVVKVDQGIKKRGKQGLVKVNVTVTDLPSIIQSWQKLGWSNFLVEPVVEHSPEAEKYLAIERTREGWLISYSDKGGVDVESNWASVKRMVLNRDSRVQLEKGVSADEMIILNSVESILPALDEHHISFLEINPCVIRGNQLIPLDMACEVDSAASPLPALPDRVLAPSENAVAALDASTPASLKFRLINPEGKIWMLLSGGGASLVLADEVADLGLGQELANYGEYSGAPTDDDVYAYTKVILSQLLNNKYELKIPRAIIIAGGVANFTDVAKTFRGLIRALDEQKGELVRAKVKVFVRRGGPNEVKGLGMMREFLNSSGLLGSVHGHDIPLTQVVSEVKSYLTATTTNTALIGELK